MIGGISVIDVLLKSGVYLSTPKCCYLRIAKVTSDNLKVHFVIYRAFSVI